MKTRGRKAVALSCAGALGIAALLAALGRGQIVEWLDRPLDARRTLVTLDLKWNEKDGVRCWTLPYLRPDGTWVDVHEFSTDPGSKATISTPALDEIETYLKFRKRDRTPWFGEPRQLTLTVLVHHEREVPEHVLDNIIALCKRLGIVDVGIDSDD